MANVLVVGANQGIGYYLVERLLELGNTVTVLDIQIHAIEILKEKYQKTLQPVIADARSLSDIESGVLQAIRNFGDIDIAIQNACLCTFESEHDTDFEIYQKVMDVNYFGALRLAKTVLPHMRRVKKGRIIFTSSGVGVTGFANISPYASSSLPNPFPPSSSETKSISRCRPAKPLRLLRAVVTGKRLDPVNPQSANVFQHILFPF